MTVDNAGVFTTATDANLVVVGGFTQNGTGVNVIGGDISATDADTNISFATGVTLTSSVADDTIVFTTNNGTALGNGNITLSSTLSNQNNESIEFVAGLGDISVVDAVALTGATGGNITVTTANNATFSSTVNANNFTQAQGAGLTTFGDLVTLAGNFDFTGNALTMNGVGNNTVGGTMTVDNAGVFTTGAAADFMIGGVFTQSSTATTGTSDLSANITAASISFADAIELSGNVTMESTAGDITLSNTVDSLNANDLTLTSFNDITLSSNVGATNALGNIVVTTANNVTANGTIDAASLVQTFGSGQTYLAGDVTTSGALGVNITTDNIQLGAITIDTSEGNGVARFNAPTFLDLGDVTVTTGSGNITFEDILDGGHSLVLLSSGDERFNGAVGSMVALTSIQTDTPIDHLGKVIFNGGLVKTTGAQTYNDAAILGVDTTLDGDQIKLASTVNGAKSLTIIDDGQTTLGGEIGGITPLVNLTVDTAGGLVLPKTTLSANMSLTTEGAVTQVGALYVGGTTHINAGSNAITLTNAANDFVGVVGSLDGTSVGVKGTVVSITDKNNINLGQIQATAGAVTINAGGSIYNGLTGVTNITSTAASMLGGNGGVVGTLARPVTVNLPSVTATATQQQGGVSIDLSGRVGDNTIWLTQTPPGLVILNGMILNAGQIPGVPQNAYATALAVLDQTYLTGNGAVLNTKPYSAVGTMMGSMYPTDDNDKAFNYGPYIYKLPTNIKVNGGGIKLPAGVQIISMNK